MKSVRHSVTNKISHLVGTCLPAVRLQSATYNLGSLGTQNLWGSKSTSQEFSCIYHLWLGNLSTFTFRLSLPVRYFERAWLRKTWKYMKYCSLEKVNDCHHSVWMCSVCMNSFRLFHTVWTVIQTSGYSSPVYWMRAGIISYNVLFSQIILLFATFI